MDILIKVVQFIASFSLIVLVHELGHFMFARMFGVRVEKFYLFFNPWFSVFKFNFRGTEYGMGWIPFGGYCKIAGMIDESMDTESMKQPARSDEFRSKPAWQRLLVMVGGVLMNVVLTLCIYIGTNYAWGTQYISNPQLTQGSYFNDLAKEIGFRDGDRILELGGEQIENYHDIYRTILLDQIYSMDVIRGGEKVRVDIDEKYIPAMNESPDFMQPRVPFIIGKVMKGGGADLAGVKEGDRPVALDGEKMHYHDQYIAVFATHASDTVNLTVERDSAGVATTLVLPVLLSADGKMGVSNSGVELLPVNQHRYSFLQSIPAGIRLTYEGLADYWKQLRMIADPKTEAYKSVGGVMAIGNIFPSFWDWQSFWHITAFISIVLAIMNLLPLPALDGGHVAFLLFEVISGRKPSDRFMEIATTIGILIIFAILLLANGNDIYRFFIK